MKNKSYPSKDVLITMLRFALIDIRATDDIKEAKMLADLFHNLPPQLLLKWDDEIRKNAFSQISNKAKRYGVENYILELQKSAQASTDNG